MSRTLENWFGVLKPQEMFHAQYWLNGKDANILDECPQLLGWRFSVAVQQGESVMITTQVIKYDENENIITTKSGSEYKLGTPLDDEQLNFLKKFVK